MPDPRALGDAPIPGLPELLAYVNQRWLPDYRLLRKKLAAMLGTPAVFAEPFWDGQAWHALQEGTVGPDIPDADSTIEVADGNIRIARRGSLTGDRIVNLGIGDLTAGASFRILNLSEFTLSVTLTFSTLSLGPMSACRVHVQDALWHTSGRYPILLDPERIP